MKTRLILLPGWGLDPQVLQPLCQALREQGEVSVELVELPALSSGKPMVWLEELDARLPNDCWLGGWSLGGMLAAALAARRGARCHGLVTLASNACFVARPDWPQAMSAGTFAAFRAGCAVDSGNTLKRFSMLCAQGSGEARTLSRQLQQALSSATPEHLLAGLSVLAALDNRAALSIFSGPQLHLLADHDALVPAMVAEALLELVPAGEVGVLEDSSHAFVMEQPRAVAAMLTEFIGGARDD